MGTLVEGHGSYTTPRDTIMSLPELKESPSAAHSSIRNRLRLGYLISTNIGLGMALFNKGRLNEAKSAWNCALNNYHEAFHHGNNWTERGDLLLTRHHYKAAFTNYYRDFSVFADKYYRGNGEAALVTEGLKLAASGGYEKAANEVQSALNRTGTFPDGEYTAAQLAFVRGQRENAKREWLSILTDYVPTTSDLPWVNPTTMAAVRMLVTFA